MVWCVASLRTLVAARVAILRMAVRVIMRMIVGVGAVLVGMIMSVRGVIMMSMPICCQMDMRLMIILNSLELVHMGFRERFV